MAIQWWVWNLLQQKIGANIMLWKCVKRTEDLSSNSYVKVLYSQPTPPSMHLPPTPLIKWFTPKPLSEGFAIKYLEWRFYTQNLSFVLIKIINFIKKKPNIWATQKSINFENNYYNLVHMYQNDSKLISILLFSLLSKLWWKLNIHFFY